MKREFDLQEGSRRKVLRLEEGLEGDASSGSDGEGTASGKKNKDSAGQNMDMQVTHAWKNSTNEN